MRPLTLTLALAACLAAAPGQAGPKPESESHRSYTIEDYFPAEAEGAFRYCMTTRKRILFFCRKRQKLLVRRPRLRRDDLRIRDSEGDVQVLTPGAEGPALKYLAMDEAGFTQTYQPALTLFPSQARIGESETYASVIKHRDHRGRHIGAVERTVTLEDIESIDTPAGSFEDCLRFRAVTINRPKIGEPFHVCEEETIWLARGTGEVQSCTRLRFKYGQLTLMEVEVDLELLETKGVKIGPDRIADRAGD